MNTKDIINSIIIKGKSLQQPRVYFVANVDGKTETIDYDNSEHTILTEYLTDAELDDMLTAFKDNYFEIKFFYNEDDFIKYAYNNMRECKSQNAVVFNLSRNGKGINKKALIPAFCNLHDIAITGSGAYHVCLGRHKYHTNSLLKCNGVEVANSWLYTPLGWLLNKKPPYGMKVIMKPTFESASRGITYNSIRLMDNSIEDALQKMSLKFHQDVIVQEFISGFEVGVPIIITDQILPLGTVGISMNSEYSMGERIITFDDAFNETYSFFTFNDIEPTIAKQVQSTAINAAACMGLEQYCRIDFRITEDGAYYITDTSTHPYLIKHSAFAFAFNQMGFSFSDIFSYLVYQRMLEKSDD